MDKAGRDSEVSMQIVKMGKSIRLDVEHMCVGLNVAKSAGSASTPRVAASVLSWLKSNTSEGAAPGADPAAADGTGVRVAGVLRPYTEILLKEVLASIYSNSSEEANLLLVGPKQKQVMSTFVGNATRFVDAAPETIYSAVDRYVHDFGSLEIRPDRVVRATDALLINKNLWKLAWLRPLESEKLAKTGDAEKHMMLGEVTLESRNEAGSGGVFDLS